MKIRSRSSISKAERSIRFGRLNWSGLISFNLLGLKVATSRAPYQFLFSGSLRSVSIMRLVAGISGSEGRQKLSSSEQIRWDLISGSRFSSRYPQRKARIRTFAISVASFSGEYPAGSAGEIR